jgi:agmatine deiminase
MQREVLAANRFTGAGISWMYNQQELDSVYTNFYNCDRVIALESFQLDPGPTSLCSRRVIDHVDMFMTFVSPQTVIVARLDEEDAAFDPANAAILDRNAQTLSDAGYNIVRIPQPARYCTAIHGPSCGSAGTCVAGPNETRECVGTVDRVWATYANSMRVGNRMLVPVYHDPVSDSSPLPQDLKDRINRQEAEALDTFQATLDSEFGPGAVTVVPVVSDDMIPCQGSMHCISMTYGPSATP